MNAPFLNSPSFPVLERVPSGKKSTDVPLTIVRLALFIDSRAFSWFDRSMNMCPTFSHPMPSPGIFRSSCLSTHLKIYPYPSV